MPLQPLPPCAMRPGAPRLVAKQGVNDPRAGVASSGSRLTNSNFGASVGTTARQLPSDVESRIILLRPGDALPAHLIEIPGQAGTHRRTGEIFVNATFWETLNDAQKARVFFEELSHQSRVLATPTALRPVREVFHILFDTLKFIEEFRAATYATQSGRQGFRYAWNYPVISRLQIAGEVAFVVGVPSLIIYMNVNK